MVSPKHPSDPARPNQESAHGWHPPQRADEPMGVPASPPSPFAPGRGATGTSTPDHGTTAFPQGPSSGHSPTGAPQDPGYGHSPTGVPQGSGWGHGPGAPQAPGHGTAFPQGPTHGHGQPAFSQGPSSGYGRGDGAGASNYVPPPPPPAAPTPPGAPQGHVSFDDEQDRKKRWRNVVIGLLALIAAGWLVIWLLGALAARLVNLVPTEVDVALGEDNWQQLAPESARCSDPAALAYVEQLAAPLLAVDDSGVEFHFAVVESQDVNAFALPGGFVTVNMGLLEVAETGEEIAAVIAHEMTHVTHRHGMRAVLRRVGGLALVSMVFGGTNLEVIAYAAEGLAEQAHSRDQERDADDGGRELLMAAGIDPTGMATFFERLEAQQGSLPGAAVLLSTHPNPGERAKTTREIAASFRPTVDLPDPPPDLRCHATD